VKKIYTHSNLVSLFDQPVIQVNTVQEAPNNCDLVTYSLHSHADFNLVVDTLLSKSKYVLIDIDELTSVDVFLSAQQLLNKHNNLKIVSQIKTDYDNKINFSGHWFMSPINFYSYSTKSNWAIDFLNKINYDNFCRPYLFDCLLGRQKNDRDCIEFLYNTSTEKEKILFTYYKNDIKKGIWDLSVDSIVDSGQLVNYNDDVVVPSTTIPISVYNQSYYSIVSETLTFNDYVFYTEKIAKPILAKRPFIVFSGQNYLKNLKSLGFKTFDCIIDESYDNIFDFNERAKHAWQQVETLTKLDPKYVYSVTKHVREHNYHLFRSTDWTLPTRQYISQLIQMAQ
jgi:hypothetical protein